MLRKIAMVVATLSAVAGCAAGPSAQDDDFAHTFSVCRFQHTGATNQKVALPATEEHVRQCLARRGWLPTAERVPPVGGSQ